MFNSVSFNIYIIHIYIVSMCVFTEITFKDTILSGYNIWRLRPPRLAGTNFSYSRLFTYIKVNFSPSKCL